jgi:hypothetical protein
MAGNSGAGNKDLILVITLDKIDHRTCLFDDQSFCDFWSPVLIGSWLQFA